MTTARFWREIPSRYNLVGSTCGNCGRSFFPPRVLCPDCHRKSIGKMKRERFDGEGEIKTFTIVHQAQKGFEMQVPYILAIIKIRDGVRVTGQIVEAEPGEVEIGKKVKPVLRRISEEGPSGAIHYGYKFVLVD